MNPNDLKRNKKHPEWEICMFVLVQPCLQLSLDLAGGETSEVVLTLMYWYTHFLRVIFAFWAFIWSWVVISAFILKSESQWKCKCSLKLFSCFLCSGTFVYNIDWIPESVNIYKWPLLTSDLMNLPDTHMHTPTGTNKLTALLGLCQNHRLYNQPCSRLPCSTATAYHQLSASHCVCVSKQF